MKMSHITFYLAQSVTEKLYNAYCNSTLYCGSAYFDYEYLSIMDSPLSSCVISYVPSQTYKCSKVARASSACSGRLHKMNWCYTDIKGHFFSPLVLSLSTPPPQVCSVCPLRHINIAEMLWEQLCGLTMTEHPCKNTDCCQSVQLWLDLFGACDAAFCSMEYFLLLLYLYSVNGLFFSDMWLLQVSMINNGVQDKANIYIKKHFSTIFWRCLHLSILKV